MRISFNSLPNKSFLGQVIRWPLRLIPKNAVLPILQGPLRGTLWIVGSHTHGCWAGSYELPTQQAFERFILPGSVVYDIGAQAGFYTLLASRLARPNGRVLAVEPVPLNLSRLRRHLSLNRVKNVEVAEGAAGNTSGTVRMNIPKSPAMAHLSNTGALEVSLFTLDELRRRLGFPYPTAIKIDTEGAEVAVLRGAEEILGQSRPVIILSTHSPSLQRQCLELLRGKRYTCSPIGPDRGGTSTEWLAKKP